MKERKREEERKKGIKEEGKEGKRESRKEVKRKGIKVEGKNGGKEGRKEEGKERKTARLLFWCSRYSAKMRRQKELGPEEAEAIDADSQVHSSNTHTHTHTKSEK